MKTRSSSRIFGRIGVCKCGKVDRIDGQRQVPAAAPAGLRKRHSETSPAASSGNTYGPKIGRPRAMKIGCAIAKMASTSTQAVIARLEGGGSKPRLQALDTHLERYAEAMGSRLRITFEPESARP
jgi:hypothetical protein